MKTSKLDISICGVRGKSLEVHDNKGQVIIRTDQSFADLNSYISVDAFQGQGDTYKRREECNIEICQCEKVLFSGTFDELCKAIKPAYVETREHIAEAYLCETDEYTVKEQIALIEKHLASGGSEWDLCSHVDDVCVWEPLEFSLTIRQFLEAIWVSPNA